MINIERIISSTKTPLFDKPIVIYGAGNTGQAVCSHLQSQGREVVAFIDQNAEAMPHCLGKPVFTVEQCIQNITLGSVDLLVGVHNRDVHMPPLIKGLNKYGFIDILTMIDYTNVFPSDESFRYWLSPRSLFTNNKDKIIELYGLFKEPISVTWLDNIVQFRITGDYSCLPIPDIENQYTPPDLQRWCNPLRLIDCGAYIGDTMEQLMAHGYEIEKVLAFEPDLGNYSKLTTKFSDSDHIYLPCGVSSTNYLANFAASGGEGSHQVKEGGVSVQMVRIDDVMPNFKPNLIKMDVEGGEIDALLGARNMIERTRPGLAVSLYHKPDDLWQIPLLIDSWNLDYKFFIRGHHHSSFDSVLYAFAS